MRPSGANPGESGIFFLWFNCITFEDSLRLRQSMLVLLKVNELLSPEDSSKLNDWLKIRMNNDAVTLVQSR